MWLCECGCAGIAAGLTRCPMCGKEKPVPTITSGGPSNAWEPVEEVQPTSEAIPNKPAEATVPPTPAPKKQTRSAASGAEK